MRVIPLAALAISQKTTPRPAGVLTEALTVSPAAINLGPAAATQRDRRTRRPLIGVSSPRLDGGAACRNARRARHLVTRDGSARETLRHNRLSRLPRSPEPGMKPAVPPSPWLRSSSRAQAERQTGSDLAPWRSICATIAGNSQCARSRSTRPVAVGRPAGRNADASERSDGHARAHRRSRASGRAPPSGPPPRRHRGGR